MSASQTSIMAAWMGKGTQARAIATSYGIYCVCMFIETVVPVRIVKVNKYLQIEEGRIKKEFCVFVL